VAIPRPPDWLIYAGAVLGLVVLAVAKQERADAPPAPPPIADVAGIGLSDALRTSPLHRFPRQGRERASGTAFSVSEAGVWITARHVVNGCRRAAVLVSRSRGVEARVVADPGDDLAVLTTEGGAPPLPLGTGAVLKSGQRAYLPGFPQGAPGEVATRLVGGYRLRQPSRQQADQDVLAWAEVGRTDGLKGSLAGLSGAPVLDGSGRVIGVGLAESPRRGRIYTASPSAIAATLQRARVMPAGFAEGRSISRGNYGRVADALRRDLRVAPVACLD
jgi:S1-C subfamily serine protease